MLREQFGNIVGGERALVVADELLNRHREAHRRYHGVAHLIHVVTAVNAAAASGAVVVAAWFHDAVYNPRSSTNEADSAELARARLRECGCAAAFVADVERLVLATREHLPTQTDEALLIDADLAVLAAAPDVYDGYVAGIRSEYAHVTDEQWSHGRRRVLEGFLAQPCLFYTGETASHEAAARANIEREVRTLRSAPFS